MEFKKVCKDNTMRENSIPSSKMKVLKKINQRTKKTTLSSHLTRPCASGCAPMFPRRMVVPEGKTFLPREPKTHGFGKNCLVACFQARLMKKNPSKPHYKKFAYLHTLLFIQKLSGASYRQA